MRALPPALAAASRAERLRRPLYLGPHCVGSVAAEHLAALRGLAAALALDDQGVRLPVQQATAVWAELNPRLREAGLVQAWRDEVFGVPDPATLQVLATLERAAARFWGTLTFGAHANGVVRDGAGRPTHLWIATRSPHKPTDPGLLDNLIGGGVPFGQTPQDALWREGWEEAGVPLERMQQARAAGVLRLHRDIPEGFQHEWLYAYDLDLPPGWQPCNQDGEVAAFACLPVQEALALACGEGMTVDAALVTLDFGRRHGLLADAGLAQALLALQVTPPR